MNDSGIAPEIFFLIMSEQGGKIYEVYSHIKDDNDNYYLIAFDNQYSASDYAKKISNARRSYMSYRVTWEKMKTHPLNGLFIGINLGIPEFKTEKTLFKF